MRTFRSGISALAVLTLAPVGLALPVAVPAGNPATPVRPAVSSVPLSGAGSTANSWLMTRSATPGIPAMDRSGATLLSRPLVGRDFQLVGVTWTAAAAQSAPVEVAVRVQAGGTWSGWEGLETQDDGPDEGSADARSQGLRRSSAPLLTPPAQGVQVRVRTGSGVPPRDLAVHLVDPGSSPADAATEPAAGSGTAGAAGSAVAATPAPGIITRRQWGADERLRSGQPSVNLGVRALFLHHTDGRNTYSRAAAAAQVRAVYAFHTRVRGWSDIGYNFLVDRFGRVYEGRAGSISAPILGAHTGGFNREAVGIATLGNFDVAAPPAAMVGAVGRLMAWQAAKYEINPNGRTALISAGGGTSRYPAGARVSVRTISGHRNVGATACPGRFLYPRLPSIRAQVTAAMRPALAAATVDRVTTPQNGPPITFSARIPTYQRWLVTLTSSCGATVRTISGRSAQRVTVPWNLRDQSGQQVPAGIYRLRVRSWSPAGSATEYRRDVELLPTPGGPRNSCTLQRVAVVGGLAESTIEVAGRTAPSATEVVIAPAWPGNASDALVAAAFARSRGAALLLSSLDALPTPVVAEVIRRAPVRAWVIGRTTAIHPAVVSQLTTLGVPTVTRIGRSADSYLLAADVARAMAPQSRAVLVPLRVGSTEVSAAASVAAALGRPLLYFDARRGLPGATVGALRDLGITTVDLVAARGSIPTAVSAQLRARGVTGYRSTGRTSLDAATALATRYARTLRPRGIAVISASPARMKDGIVAAASGRLTLLTSSPVGAGTRAWLRAQRPTSIWVASPATVLPPTVLRSLTDAVTR